MAWTRGTTKDKPKPTQSPRHFFKHYYGNYWPANLKHHIIQLCCSINITPQVPAYPHVLRIVELRASGVVVLEGSDAARCTRQMKDVAHCPLPILDTTLHPGRYYRETSMA